MGANGIDNQYQRVIGASEENPPAWHSKFSKKSSTLVQYGYSYATYQLPPNYLGRGEVLWDRDLGWEEFELYQDNQPTGLKLRRDREWHENPGWAFIIREITQDD